jgi:hypothetical protein
MVQEPETDTVAMTGTCEVRSRSLEDNSIGSYICTPIVESVIVEKSHVVKVCTDDEVVRNHKEG